MSQTQNHKCEIAGCGLYVPTNKLMCAKHWAMVSSPLQSSVYETWGRLSRMLKDLTKFPQEYRVKTIEAHRVAKQLAIESVENKLEAL